MSARVRPPNVSSEDRASAATACSDSMSNGDEDPEATSFPGNKTVANLLGHAERLQEVAEYDLQLAKQVLEATKG